MLGGLAPPCYEEVSIIFDPPLDPAESAEENAVFFKTCLCDHCLIRAELEAHGQCVSEKVWGGRKEVFGGSRLDGTILHGSGAASFHAFLDDAA